ncbi:hypothetical protein L195_g014192 [Trifolium pratense]|uniref:Reverse transcriptase zinc-binding domain-containing protein n=1 Tax=Trifolium pratense TaxID=57577 RepID=A0A2K3PQ86_TRIPR|nr:hypothetical protein L195_g014192 [Trifolium pratense]
MCGGVFMLCRDNDNPYVTSLTVADYEGMRVSDLMQPNERKWNEALIHQLFNLRDATEILKIPVSCMREEDVPIWRFSKNSVYSVLLAYYQLMEAVIDNTHLRVEGDWMKIWKLKVPNRVKIFIWRTLRGCLPVLERQLKRFGEKREIERKWSNMYGMHKVKRRARESLDDWLRVCCRREHNNFNASRVVQQNWTKPQQGSFKCNVDATCYVTENRGARSRSSWTLDHTSMDTTTSTQQFKVQRFNWVEPGPDFQQFYKFGPFILKSGSSLHHIF